jgi:DNA-binding response OmpR family regulator
MPRENQTTGVEKMTRPRKPRVLIFDDDAQILNMLEKYFTLKGYDALAFSEPTSCLIYGDSAESCSNLHPCADILITDFDMPHMTGVKMIERQQARGCRLEPRNKAVISGFMDDEYIRKTGEMGCAFFRKPFLLTDLDPWIKECESRMDLSLPVGIRRRELRHPANDEVAYRCGSCNEARNAVVTNVSKSGLCLKVPESFPCAESIVINDGSSSSCRSAEVRWVRKEDEDLFVVGLACSLTVS